MKTTTNQSANSHTVTGSAGSGTTSPYGPGYQCSNCGAWVLPNTWHSCQTNPYYYPPAPNYVIDFTQLIGAIKELTEEVKKLQDIIAKQR